MLSKFYHLLKPGGRVLLDVYSLYAFNQKEEDVLYEINLFNGFWSPETYYGFLTTFKYDDEKVMLDKYTIIEQSRTRVIYNWLQYFSPASITQEFESCGFDIEACFSDVAGAPYTAGSMEIAVVARKA